MIGEGLTSGPLTDPEIERVALLPFHYFPVALGNLEGEHYTNTAAPSLSGSVGISSSDPH